MPIFKYKRWSQGGSFYTVFTNFLEQLAKIDLLQKFHLNFRSLCTIYQVKIIQTSKSIFTKHPIHRLSIQNSVFSLDMNSPRFKMVRLIQEESQCFGTFSKIYVNQQYTAWYFCFAFQTFYEPIV